MKWQGFCRKGISETFWGLVIHQHRCGGGFKIDKTSFVDTPKDLKCGMVVVSGISRPLFNKIRFN